MEVIPPICSIPSGKKECKKTYSISVVDNLISDNFHEKGALSCG